MKKREFTFANLLIEVPESLYNYSVYRQKFNKIAINKANTFYSEFYVKFKGMDDLVENGFQYGLEIIKSVIEVAVEELVKKGMYDINEEYFTNEFVPKYFLWENSFNQLLEAYYKICLTEEEAKQYRENRKNNRSRWRVLSTTGDFSKAVDAQITAGMWNIAEGIGHSIFNAIGNAVSKATAEVEKMKLFQAEETLTELTESVYLSCFYIHFALIDALCNSKDNYIISIEELLDAKGRADRLLENIKKNRIPFEDKDKVLKTIISTYPYDLDIYKYLINEKFNIREVAKLASYFSEDISELLFGNSILDIRTNIDNYDFYDRSIIISAIEDLGSIETDFDAEMAALRNICLNYNSYQFSNSSELEKAMEEDDDRLSLIVQCLKKYDYNSSVYIDNIPDSKIKNATQSYGIPFSEEILVLIDSTRSGSANEGVAFCKKGIYMNSNQKKESQNILYKDFGEILSIEKSLFGVDLLLSNNKKIEMSLAGSNLAREELIEIMHAISQILLNKDLDLSNVNENTEIEQSMLKKDNKKIYKNASNPERFICCFIPPLGLILYFTWKKDKPNKARDAIIMTVMGSIMWFFTFKALMN